MRMSRRLGLGGKLKVQCKFLGAVGETLTFVQNGVTVYTVTENTTIEVRQGTYEVTGSVSGHKETIKVTKAGTYNAYPAGAVYWYGREIYPITVQKEGKNGTYSTTANATKNAQSVHLYVKTRGDAGATMRAAMYTTNAINTSGYSEIKIKATLGDSAYTHSRTLGYKSSSGVADFGNSASSGVNTITSPKTSVYLGATAKATTYGSVYSISEMTVHAIWMEGGSDGGGETPEPESPVTPETPENPDVPDVPVTPDEPDTPVAPEEEYGEEVLAGWNTIDVDSETYRYTTEDTNRPWLTANAYSDMNYFGKKEGSSNTCLIPVGKFSFDGRSTRMVMTAYVYKPSSSFPAFRWAVCTSSANKTMYQSATGVVNDSTKIVGGTATLSKVGWNMQSFEFDSKDIPSDTDLYIYLYPSGFGGVAHIDRTITVDMYYKPLLSE